MQLFCNDVGQQHTTITEFPFQVDILEVYHDRIYVVSAAKQISIFDMVTFKQVFKNKKIETLEKILHICFYGENIFVGERNTTLEVFCYSSLERMMKLNTRNDITCLIALDNVGIVLGQEEGCIDILNPFHSKTILVQEIHPFCDKITCLEKTSRAEICEIATVTAGQIFFTTIGMKQTGESGL